jgi:hypothetical protein
MQKNFYVPGKSLPQMPEPCGTPIISIVGLLDLLTALEDQLAACPGAIPVLANTLRDELEEVVDDGR